MYLPMRIQAMIAITISGNRGEGKTVTAMTVYRLLKDAGHNVKLKCRTKEHTRLCEKMAYGPDAPSDTITAEIVDDG